MSERLNILLITTDEQRYDAVGFNNPVVKTPNLNQMALQGIVFNRAYTPSPVCTPARNSILTGCYPSRHGSYNIGVSLPEDFPTVPGILATQGYLTTLVGKAHFQSWRTAGGVESIDRGRNWDFYRAWEGPFYGFQKIRLSIGHSRQDFADSCHYGLWLREQGVDPSKYFGVPDYTIPGTWPLPEELTCSHWIGDETVTAIDQSVARKSPFFIWMSFMDPHAPLMVSEPWASLHDRKEMPVYGLHEGELEGKPPFYRSLVETGDYGSDDEAFVEKSWKTVRNDPGFSETQKQEAMAIYYGMVSQIDYHVGRVLEHLRMTGLIDKTIVVFTTDHGDYMGNHGLWYKGMPAYEDILRLPFVVYHPHCKTPGARSDAMQNLVDLGPTFLRSAGVDLPYGMQGIDQSDTWVDRGCERRTWSLTEFRPSESNYMQKTYVNRRHKLILYNRRPYGELYDLHEDPDQYRNLYSDPEHQHTVQELLREVVFAEMDKEVTLRTRTAPS